MGRAADEGDHFLSEGLKKVPAVSCSPVGLFGRPPLIP
jgi:hypothetical protein